MSRRGGGGDVFVYLVPVFEGQRRKGRGVGKLQVGKVPVQDLSVSGGQVDVAVEGERKKMGGERERENFIVRPFHSSEP